MKFGIMNTQYHETLKVKQMSQFQEANKFAGWNGV